MRCRDIADDVNEIHQLQCAGRVGEVEGSVCLYMDIVDRQAAEGSLAACGLELEVVERSRMLDPYVGKLFVVGAVLKLFPLVRTLVPVSAVIPARAK